MRKRYSNDELSSDELSSDKQIWEIEQKKALGEKKC